MKVPIRYTERRASTAAVRTQLEVTRRTDDRIALTVHDPNPQRQGEGAALVLELEPEHARILAARLAALTASASPASAPAPRPGPLAPQPGEPSVPRRHPPGPHDH